MDRLITKKRYSAKRDEEKRVKEVTAGFSDRINPDFVKAPAIAKNEETVLGILLLYPEKARVVFERSFLNETDFYTEFNRKVFNFIKEAYERDAFSYESMNEAFTPEEMGRISRMKLRRMQLTNTEDDILTECIENLKRAVLKKQASATSTFEGLDAVLKRKRNN